MGKGCFAYQALAFASDQRCCANPGAASAVRSSRTRETRKAAGDFWCMMFLTGKSKSGIFAESDYCYAFVRKAVMQFPGVDALLSVNWSHAIGNALVVAVGNVIGVERLDLCHTGGCELAHLNAGRDGINADGGCGRDRVVHRDLCRCAEA